MVRTVARVIRERATVTAVVAGIAVVATSPAIAGAVITHHWDPAAVTETPAPEETPAPAETPAPGIDVPAYPSIIVGTIPPCPQDEVTGDPAQTCYWDAALMGNGTGVSFVVIHGVVYMAE